MFQHKLLFNLVKDLFKWIEGLGRSVTVRVQSGSERIFDLGGMRKKYSVRCQISRWKTHYKVFQHKLLFNLVKDWFKWIEGLGRSFTVWVQSERKNFFDLGGIRKKYSIRCQISRSKNRYIVFQHKLLFNLVKDLFKWIEGLEREECQGPSTVWEWKNFWPRWYTKSTRYVVKFRAEKLTIKCSNINCFSTYSMTDSNELRV